jgi:hypothetical protein
MTAVYCRNEAVLVRRTPDGLVLLPLPRRQVVTVTGAGSLLWDLLEEPRSVEQLGLLLADTFAAEPEHIARDIAPVVEDLAARRVLHRIELT